MGARPILWSMAAGLIAGAVLDVLAYWMASSGPVGDGWSFRGNGALIVPFGLGPAVLAGGWAALALYYRGAVRWLALGIAAGIVGALPAALSVLVLLVVGRGAQALSDILTLAAFGWPIVATVLAAVLPLSARVERRAGLTACLLAGMALVIGLLAGFVGVELVLPPGS